jgi:Xaa-Pro dipeptidase
VLVFPRAGEPTSFIYSPVFTDYWRGAQNWVSDVRPKRGTFGDSVADRLTELGLAGAKVGIDGLAGPLDPDGWVPHSMYARLQERLPKVTLVNLDDMMEKLRTVKSAEEIAILEKAAALGDLMLQACRDTARPGVKECEVYARMMETMLANGGEEPTLFLWAADAHPYPHPFRVPTTRPLAKGDMIICEMHPKSAVISPTSNARSAWGSRSRAISTSAKRASTAMASPRSNTPATATTPRAPTWGRSRRSETNSAPAWCSP